jgi:DNA-binding response OmpR family regulator
MSDNKIKILIVDDEKDILVIYHDKFTRSGFEVISTDKGSEAMELAKNNQPDLILLDIMMPDTDGYQIIKNLKEFYLTKQIPVIMLSNLGYGEAIQKGIIAGADDYIVKVNYTPAELVEKVKNFLKKNKS